MKRIEAQNRAIIEAIPPQAGNSAISGDYASMKNCARLTVICQIKQATAATIVCAIEQATTVAGAGVKALANAVPICSNLDTASSDTMVQRTDGVDYTTDAAVKNKIVTFDIFPEHLDVDNGFDCVHVKVTSTNAGDIVSALYLADGRRYPGLSMIVD